MHILDQPLSAILNLKSRDTSALKEAHILTARDILLSIPNAYVNVSSPVSIASLKPGSYALIRGVVESVSTKKLFPKKTPYTEARIRDENGFSVRVLWFTHSKVSGAPKGEEICFSGKVHCNKKGELFFVNPVRSKPPQATTDPLLADQTSNEVNLDENITPIYPRIRGISPHTLDLLREEILHALPKNLSDPLPSALRKKFNLPSFEQALRYIHHPPSSTWAIAARKRFAFEEMFTIQLHRLRMRHALTLAQTYSVPPSRALFDITTTLPFPLTKAQERATADILRDMSQSSPMTRLLEGDVGSGKTLVAIIASLAAVRAGFQVAYLAPTEILALQHFKEYCERLRQFHISIGLITSAESKSFPSKLSPKDSTHISRAQLLTWVGNGKLSILIGTHALLEHRVIFKNLALAVIDEQHRFGIQQRSQFMSRTTPAVPHLLSMTATPIPRTLALTLYGDLDISLLDEMPHGRKKPITKIVSSDNRAAAYEFIRNNIRSGGQAFVICPRIEDAVFDTNSQPSAINNQRKATLEMKSVKAEYKKLSEDIFPDLTVAILHGKIKPQEKENIINDFRKKKTHILVSTSVVEVGMDIPNASVMMIEGADRFGLASLHQFRGRVGRAGQQAYCFVFTESKNQKTWERLQAFMKAKNGFELAEHDLLLRGAGELSGGTQWGVTDLGMEALKNIKMVEAAQEEAKKLIGEDVELTKYPDLRERVLQLEIKGLHLE